MSDGIHYRYIFPQQFEDSDYMGMQLWLDTAGIELRFQDLKSSRVELGHLIRAIPSFMNDMQREVAVHREMSGLDDELKELLTDD